VSPYIITTGKELEIAMKLVLPEQMNAIDACAIKEYGIPGLLLMENAASAVVSEAASMLGGCRGRRVVVLAGRGNNGGDGFAAARLLHCKGADVHVYLIGSKATVSGDALANLTILEGIGIQVIELLEEKSLDALCADMEKAQLILDGIFGIGLNRGVSGLAGAVIERANASGKAILSIDIPSGVDGTDGTVKGACINATATVTFCLPKTGLVLHPGCEYTGRLITSDIGMPLCAINRQELDTDLIDTEMVSPMIPCRTADSNKGDYGKVMLVTGSTGMTGSGCLASMAALRSGAGLVYAGVPESLAQIYSSALTEPIILPLEDGGSGCLAGRGAAQILEHMKRMNVAAVGPGLTALTGIKEIVEKIINESTIPLVLDADALNAISGNTGILKKLSVKAAVTPHPGEMARMTGLSIHDVQADRVGIAKKFAASHGVTVVLKGSRTIVAQPDGHIFINTTGNAGMATAGTGDVLTGIIAGLAAQGASIGDAAVAGVFLHGLAGDDAAAEMGPHSLLASDVIKHLPQTIKKVLGRITWSIN
jgi:NAD(P)H-hydrate epimerase